MSSRAVYVVAAILTLTAGYACWCRAPLIWDGGYQFTWTLETQHPYVYLTRFHTFFLWWPTVWASHFTSNYRILQTVFGLPFLLAPVVSLLLCWWIVKDHQPALMIWVVFGVAIATLPGQIFVINDSIFQQHLFWPLYVGLFVPLTSPKRIVLGFLAIFQFVHPIGILLLLGAALAAGGVAIFDQSRRKSLLMGAVIMLALCLAVVAKVEISQHIPRWHDYYAEQQGTWKNAVILWQKGVVPVVLYGLIGMWLAAPVVFAESLLRRHHARLALAAGLIGIGCVGMGAVWWAIFLHGPRTGEGIWLERRDRLSPLDCADCISIFLFLAAQACAAARSRPGAITPSKTVHGPLALLLATTFALYLGMQSMTWSHELDRLMLELHDYPSVVMPLQDMQLKWTWETPLTHWATGNSVSAIQGKVPAKMFLDLFSEGLVHGQIDPPGVKGPPQSAYYPIPIDRPPGKQGWYDFRPMLEQLAKEPPSTRPRRADNVQ